MGKHIRPSQLPNLLESRAYWQVFELFAIIINRFRKVRRDSTVPGVAVYDFLSARGKGKKKRKKHQVSFEIKHQGKNNSAFTVVTQIGLK